MKMISIGPVEGKPAVFEKALGSAVDRLGAPPALAIVYLPKDADHRQFLRIASSATDAMVVGMTTGGAAFTERGVTATGAVCALIGGDVEVQCAVARNIKSAPEESIRKAIGGMNLRSGPNVSMLVLMDAFAADGEVLVSALRRSTPIHCRCFGGTAGDDWTFTGTQVFHGREVMSDAAVFVAINSRSRLSMDVLHGFSVAEGARDLVITSIDGNILRSLDNRPAAAVYREELERMRLLRPGEDLVRVLALYELGARTPFGEQLKIRAPLAVGADGSITLASSLAKGEVVRVVTANRSQLVGAARALAARVHAPLAASGGLGGALVFDCAARRQLLGERHPEQAAAFQRTTGHPLVGVACYGEIAKFGGSVEGFHNTTAVMVGW